MGLRHMSDIIKDIQKSGTEETSPRKIQKQFLYEKPEIVFMLCAKRYSYVSKLLREVAKDFDSVLVKVADTPRKFESIYDDAIAKKSKLFCVVDIDKRYIDNKAMIPLLAKYCEEVFAFHWPTYANTERRKKDVEKFARCGRWTYCEKLTRRQAELAKKEKRGACIQETLQKTFKRLIEEQF